MRIPDNDRGVWLAWPALSIREVSGERMGRPWGLSGPEFLLLYAGLLVAVCAVVVILDQWAKTTGGQQRAAPRDLGLYEIAYLHGGADRVADTAVAGLVDTGALRVGRSHRVHATGRPGADEYQRRVLESTGYGATLVRLRKNFRASGVADSIASSLREQGLIASAGRLRAVAISVWLCPALGVVGVVRLLNGIVLGYPVAYLAGELMVTALVWAILWRRAKEPKRTRAGDRVVRPRAAERVSATLELPLGRQFAAAGTAAGLVATGGIHAYPDRELAHLLVPPAGTGSGGGGFAGSGGSCGGGGGGGCGGGGAC